MALALPLAPLTLTLTLNLTLLTYQGRRDAGRYAGKGKAAACSRVSQVGIIIRLLHPHAAHGPPPLGRAGKALHFRHERVHVGWQVR